MRTRTKVAATVAGALFLAVLPTIPLAGIVTVHAATTVGGTYHPLTPSRILDTRNGTGGYSAPVAGSHWIDVEVLGQGGVPASGVEAVVVNVTVTNTTAASFLTVFPTGATPPNASNLNWVAGQTVPNLVTVGLGGGKISAYNGYGSVDVIMDVQGYYSDDLSSPGPDGLFNPLVPSRLVDTRNGTGAPLAKLGPNSHLDVQVSGGGASGVPASGAEAVVLNVTVTNPSAPSYLIVFPTGVTMPLASNLNFRAGQTVPNRVTVGLGTSGTVTIYNGYGSTDVIVDVNGWYTDGSIGGTGSRFVPVPPARILDSRYGTGGYNTPWGPNTGLPVTVAGQGGVPLMTDTNVPTAVVANITVTGTTAPSALTAWPDTATAPLASDLNWVAGVTVPNLAVVQVGPTGKVDLLNYTGCVDVIMDVVGWFTGPPATITPGTAPAASPCPVAGNWLSRLNYWRSTAFLPAVSENTTWSAGDYNHSVWMIKNETICHCETPGTPYYTTSGAYAAANSNIEVMSSTSVTDDQSIDWWMGAPFHAMGMMDPRLSTVGFGAYRQAGASPYAAGFSLNVISGNAGSGGTYPVYWPGNGITVPLRAFSGNEFPDPLSACPGYSMPTGLPVFVEVGSNVTTNVTSHTFTANGVNIASCAIDSAHNPSLAADLTWHGGVIVMPQAVLVPGVQYKVSLTVNGAPYTWSFQVS